MCWHFPTSRKHACRVQVSNCAPAGIGALTALKQIQKLGSLEAVLDSLDKTKYPIPEPFPYEVAKGLFKGIVLC